MTKLTKPTKPATKPTKKCAACVRFFERFRCGAREGSGECDCPKCQGYCRCHRSEDEGR